MKKYPYIVAEIGGNHNGDIELGKQMIKAAKEAGADAVKFQLYRKEDLWTNDHLTELNEGVVKLENVSNWETKELGLNNIFEQVEKFAVQEQEHIEFFNYARELGIDYGTSAFVKKDIDFCIDQKVANLKIASCDVTNLDLIEYAISKDYPIQIALGMASLAEIENIVKLIPEKFRHNVTLLHCVSLYPPKDEYVNLNFLNTLRQCFGLPVGYSDHTLGYAIPLAAVALGATVIEKHFTLDKNMPGWDHKVSANPEEMKIICEASKRIVDSLGNGIKVVSDDEIAKQKKFRRTIATVKPLKAGQEITYDNIAFKRPGTGISADRYKEIIGRHVNRDIDADKTLFWEDFSKMIAIIPARGGSKGLPGKNVRPLNGKPLIAYAIEEALKAKHIDNVIVSTDDEEIARVAVEYGAELPFMRPAELASDTAMAIDNYIYTIGRLEEEGGKPIEAFVVLQPTSPLRIAEDIDGAIELFEKKKADSVISYCQEAHPVTWHKYLDEESHFVDIFDVNIKNRQDNRVSYYPNGAVYVFRTSMIRERKYYTDNSYAYVMPRTRSVDIDFIEDFEYAEFLLKRRNY